MKNTVIWFLVTLLLVGIIAGAAVMYNSLSEEYGGNSLNDPNTNSNFNSNSTTESESTDESSDDNNFKAPDFTVLDYEGNEVKLSDYAGKPVVLNFWATWCYYCKQEMPDFNDAYKKYPNVQFLMVNATDGVQETMADAKAYVEEEEYEFEVFFDTELEAVNAYYVTGFPSTYFIDSEGNLVTYANGMINLQMLEKGIGLIVESE